MWSSVIQVPTLQQNFDRGDILIQPGTSVELHLSAGVVLPLVASTEPYPLNAVNVGKKEKGRRSDPFVSPQLGEQ